VNDGSVSTAGAENQTVIGGRIGQLASVLWSKMLGYVVKFGVVGLIGMFIDVGIFNLLRLGFAGEGHFFSGPIGAKIISVSVAIVFNWVGNRYWTFREQRRKNFVMEFFEYVIVSIGGLLIGLLCLWVSHYVLGFNNVVADNISGNVVGLVLGTIFRFALYRYWVYGKHRGGGVEAIAEAVDAQRTLYVETEAPAGQSPTGPRK
jgi:putative flippase GtrA